MIIFGGIISSTIVIIILVIIIIIVLSYNSIKAMSDQLISYNQCNAIDNNGDPVYENQGGTYSDLLCPLNSLLITDPEFREKTLKIYSPSKMANAIYNIASNNWVLPNTNIIAKDQVLAGMVINEWYTSDDALNARKTIEYNSDLSSFTIDGINYNNFSNSGLNLSQYKDSKGIIVFYLYMDNNVIIELPIQLYISKLSENQRGNQKVKVKGVFRTVNVDPIDIQSIDDLKNLLDEKFYKFKDSSHKSCMGLNPDGQKENDEYCKFFNVNGLNGLIIALKRVIVVNLPENINSDYISYIEKKISLGQTLTYLEFFLWLAMLSYRDSITYDFKLIK